MNTLDYQKDLQYERGYQEGYQAANSDYPFEEAYRSSTDPYKCGWVDGYETAKSYSWYD